MTPKRYLDFPFQQFLKSGRLKHISGTFIIEEAHNLKDWCDFCLEFIWVPFIRNQFKEMTVFATTVTLPAQGLKDLKMRLYMDPDNTTVIQRCNDRPNVNWVVLPFQATRSTFHDLRFLVPRDTSDTKPLRKTLIFCKDHAEALAGAKWLRNRLGEELMDKVQWYVSLQSDQGRKGVMEAFEKGDIWVLFCTDDVGLVSEKIHDKL
jgi:superfamily II DNA helicase RecQ